jgi:small GTP-binding protein
MKRMGSFFGDTATTTTSTTTSTSTTSSPSSSPAMDQNRRELVFKILVVGDIGAGKTAIIRRAVDNVFSDAYKSTIGVDFALKSVKLNPKTTTWLQLWDIAGQERYGNLTRVYYREAVAALVVFDLTRPASFEAVRKWKNDIDTKVALANGDPIPCILVANKCDLVNVPLNEEVMNQFCKEHGFVNWMVTSAKKDVGIAEAMTAITQHIMSRSPIDDADDEDDDDLIRLTSNEARPFGYGCCWSG